MRIVRERSMTWSRALYSITLRLWLTRKPNRDCRRDVHQAEKGEDPAESRSRISHQFLEGEEEKLPSWVVLEKAFDLAHIVAAVETHRIVSDELGEGPG